MVDSDRVVREGFQEDAKGVSLYSVMQTVLPMTKYLFWEAAMSAITLCIAAEKNNHWPPANSP